MKVDSQGARDVGEDSRVLRRGGRGRRGAGRIITADAHYQRAEESTDAYHPRSNLA